MPGHGANSLVNPTVPVRTYAEISRELGISKQRVRELEHKAFRKILRAIFDDRELRTMAEETLGVASLDDCRSHFTEVA